ncbi:F-box/FBD/LRR-repeat protein At1g13570-like [Rutidosis leptorrhynchoides]|uniref:F-box/FBD/LRR-repeat protein At1g13570-like n=1 Tax=Rutidosis leptorrhynchoides TaxID=125765 RepID=UPI003A9962B7
MEPTPMKHNASKSASEDIISRMPEDVIANILDRLPIQYALRTCILSKNWRFKWTLLSNVVFDKKFFEYLQELGGENRYDERNIISRLLFHLKGSITKFHLYIPYGKVLDVKDINRWVIFLSRKGTKEFNFINTNIDINVEPIKLSTHIFSCVKLEHLTLHNCSLCPAPTFCGFPNLLSLDLRHVAFENGKFGEIITQCPLLELLEVTYTHLIGKVKVVEIAKLTNLKSLSFPLCRLDTVAISNFLVYNLVGHFSKLQKLKLNLFTCKFLEESSAGNWVRTSFCCLKTLMLYNIDFGSDSMLSFVFDMIWSSPELKTLVISAAYSDAVPQPAFCYSELNHISMEQLFKLQSVVFKSCRGSENERYLIKNLLACSPTLNKINIFVNVVNNGNLIGCRLAANVFHLFIFQVISILCSIVLAVDYFTYMIKKGEKLVADLQLMCSTFLYFKLSALYAVEPNSNNDRVTVKGNGTDTMRVADQFVINNCMLTTHVG